MLEMKYDLDLRHLDFDLECEFLHDENVPQCLVVAKWSAGTLCTELHKLACQEVADYTFRALSDTDGKCTCGRFVRDCWKIQAI